MFHGTRPTIHTPFLRNSEDSFSLADCCRHAGPTGLGSPHPSHRTMTWREGSEGRRPGMFVE
jgi:hypothetical protein